jgi:hypothetical protein
MLGNILGPHHLLLALLLLTDSQLHACIGFKILFPEFRVLLILNLNTSMLPKAYLRQPVLTHSICSVHYFVQVITQYTDYVTGWMTEDSGLDPRNG